MQCEPNATTPLRGRLHQAITAREVELTHASALGRRVEVLKDICLQLLHDCRGELPDWNDPLLRALVLEALGSADGGGEP